MIIEAGLHHRWLRAALVAGGLGFTSIVPAQTLDFGACVRIADMSSRLACYDRAAGFTQSGVVPPTPSTGAATPPAPPPTLMPTSPSPLPSLPTPGARAAAPATAPLLVAPQMPRDPVAGFGATGSEPDPLTAKKTQEPEKEKPLKQIEARVTAVRTRPEGQQVITLDNGQVWSQTEMRRDPQFAVGDVVIIKRGLLGSFLLTLQKGSASTRVQRIS